MIPRTLVVALVMSPWLALASPAGGQSTRPNVPEEAKARVLSLAEAYRLALRNNPSLELMQARVQAAEAERRRAWSQVKPTAQVAGTFTHNDPEIVVDPSAFAPPGTAPSDPIVIQQANQFGLQVQADLPLFHGPAYHQIGVAKKGVQSSRWRFARTRQTFALRVADAYYAALSAGEVVIALDEKVAVDQRNLAAARARLEVGRVTRSDVLRAELELVQDTQQRLQQQNAFAAAKRRVAILVGVEQPIALEQPNEPPSPEVPGVRSANVRQRRLDLRALQLDVAAAEQAKTAVWWSFFPLLDLNFLYRWQEAAGFAGQKDSWSLVATLTLPIYQGGARYAELQRARAHIAETRAAEAELARDIAERITQFEADLASAEAGLVSATKAVALAEVTVNDMTARYEAGSATQIDLLDVTQRRLQARIDLSRSRYARDLARLALASELGQFSPRGGEGAAAVK